MEKVPAAGYKIIGLDIQGIQRKSIWKNLLFPIKLLASLNQAVRVIKNFKPDALH
jgi:UDP-N-acetylglucosamine--N-acetylmuramyl-(pentapeptide) pyrophosphoryl-undecaprenol N-acetylglucosamine transferase